MDPVPVKLPPKSQRPSSVQARLSENDPRLYSTNRDVAHNFVGVMRSVFARLQNRVCPELEEVIGQFKLTDEELGQAVEALALFISSADEQMRERPVKPGEGFEAELIRCGFLRTPPIAQVAVWATLGMVIMGYHYAGVREATLAGQGPAMDLKVLETEGQRLARFLALPRWRRKLTMWWVRVREALRALRG